MKSFEIEALGVEELDTQTSHLTNGGNWVTIGKKIYEFLSKMGATVMLDQMYNAVKEGYDEEKASESEPNTYIWV